MKQFYLLITTLCILFTLSTHAQTIRYVRPGGSGSQNGLSWANASASLQDMIDASAANDEIWVAAGAYKPTKDPFGNASPADPRDLTFYLKDAVKIYGGFAASGNPTFAQRNPQTFVTILSGNIGLVNVSTDNCYHVVISVNDGVATLLDGFTVTAGDAGAANSIVVEGETVFQNDGAGMYNGNSNPTITNCTFSGNAANRGGGIYITSATGPTNTAALPVFFRCIFSGNTATMAGGGMYNQQSSIIATTCVFDNNNAPRGGGMFYENNRIAPSNDVAITNCLFISNIATNAGGALSVEKTSLSGTCPSISSIKITNSTLLDNIASQGGGLYLNRNCSSRIKISVIVDNSVIRAGTGGSIVQNNEGATFTGPQLFINYSNIEGFDATPFGTGNIDADPRFVNPADPDGPDNIWLTTDDGLQLSDCSPSIDAGNNAAIALTIDAAGQPRKFDVSFVPNTGAGTAPHVDMGAYENQSVAPMAGIVYVNTNLTTGADNGTSWTNAYRGVDALQKALDNIYCQGNEIWVAQGTYKPTKNPETGSSTNPNDRDNTFHLKDQVKIYGGFIGNETSLNQRNFRTNITTLSGNIGGAGNTDNCYHVVVSVNDDVTTVLDGFTISGGNASFNTVMALEGQSVNRGHGGGMNNTNSSPTIMNCVFSANSNGIAGGGMYNSINSSPAVTSCVFAGNTGLSGSGMYNINNSPALAGCVFSSNTASGAGGAIVNQSASPGIINCVFTGNTAAAGGALHNNGSSPSVTNCVFTSNTATGNGGGINNINAGANPVITNCIIQGSTIFNNTGTTSTITYSNIQGGQAGTGNIDADPRFINPADPDGPDNTWLTADDGLRLSDCSPSIDAGNNAANALTTDAAGQPRKFDVSFVPNTGAGTAPHVDMGAYENQSVAPMAGIVYVNTNLTTGADNGTSWTNAYRGNDALQKALDNIHCQGNEIWVAQGIYKPTKNPETGSSANPNDRDNTFHLKDQVKIYGGFIGNETALNQRNFKTNVTTLSGDIGTANDNTDNSYHVVISVLDGAATVLDGFTISGGNANGSGSFILENPGANINRPAGAGMYVISSSTVITNCIFSGNTAAGGAGIYNFNSSSAISNCVFSGNTAVNGGGIFSSFSSSTAITNCVFNNNSAGRGGGIYNDLSSTAITNCVFNGNTATNSGGGILNSLSSFPPITNCIFRGGSGGSISNEGTANPTVTYSNIQGGQAGTGNIDADPLFVNAADPDGADNIWMTADDGLAILPASPSFNTGNNAAVPPGISTDITGSTRIVAGTVDMGAYEIQCAPATITCPANISVNNSPGQCNAAVTYTPTVGGVPASTVTYSFTGATTGSGSGTGSGSTFNVGTTTVTLTATNSCATVTCSFTITVTDNQPPTITCPAPATVSCAALIPAANIALVTATDNCGTVTVTHRGDVISNQTCANRLTLTRTYRATDAAGNFAECTQTITVNDVTPPTITCPAPVTVSCTALVPAANIALVTAADNCAGTVVVTHVSDAISNQTCANRYTITRTYRATDVCGNFSECTQVITVNDITPPAIICPAAVTVSCASAVPAVNISAVTATDNCAGAVTVTHISDVISAQTCTNRFILTRRYRATDVCGNFSECTQIITVNDNTAPAISCPANISTVTPFGSCTAVVNFSPTAADNCGGPVTIVAVPASGSAFPIGNTTVTVTATDACGNQSACTFTVQVADAQLPVISSQPVSKTVCTGSNATFTVNANTSPVAGGPLSYQWQQWNNNAWVNIAGATASSFTITNATLAMNTNTYRVQVTGQCTTIFSAEASLYVNALPAVSIQSPGPLQLLPTQHTSLTAIVSPAGGNYQWFRNNTPLPGAISATLANLGIDDQGSYKVVYTDLNGCVNTSSEITIGSAPADILYIYPNPNNGQFHIRFYNTANEQLTVTVIDAKGALVYRMQTTASPLPYTDIPVSLGEKFATGIYIVEVRGAAARLIGSKMILTVK